MRKNVRLGPLSVPLAGLLFLSLVAASLRPTSSAAQAEQYQGALPRLIIYAKHVEGGSNVRVPAPASILQASPQNANIHVTYVGNWNPAAQTAFDYAVSIWASLISSPVPIEVHAEWTAMGSTILGGAWAEGVLSNFKGAPLANTWYPYALANALAGRDLDVQSQDINAQFNSAFPDWYFGTSGSPPFNKYDFVSVVLHELCHGLGFFDSFVVNSGSGSWGYNGNPIVYDRYVRNGAGQVLINSFPNPSTALAAQLTSNNIFFNSPSAVAANGGSPPALYAPSTWSPGSSIAHLGEVFNGTPNALMTYSLTNGEVQHDPGPIVEGILHDLGWEISVPAPQPTATALSPTPTPKPVTHTSWTYIPVVERNYQAGYKGVYGRVTEGGANAKDVTVNLCGSNGTSCTTLITTTTGTDGVFTFLNAPTLASGLKYYAYYQNRTGIPGRLWYWRTPSLDTYTAGSRVAIGNFDIADVSLLAPASSATVSLPYTFKWKGRTATPDDSYEFDLYGSNSGDPYWWTNPSLGYVSSYTLNGLPTPYSGGPFKYGVLYMWEVWVYGPEGGYGLSGEARRVTFSAPGSSPGMPASGGILFPTEEMLQTHLDLRHSGP